MAVEFTCQGRAENAEQRALALPNVMGEANELAQAVLNLLVNALDALEGVPTGIGRIAVDLSREETELVLSVADNGPGVSADELPRIADAFYTTKDVGRGTGLGLAIEGLRAEIRLPARMRSP